MKRILGAAIGNCVHVAGVAHFLDLAKQEGYETIFLGPAVSVDRLFRAIEEFTPDIISVSYRLTPSNVLPLLDEIKKGREGLTYTPAWTFGGTNPVASYAKNYDFFEFISDGYDDIVDSIRFLRGAFSENIIEEYARDIISRINNSYPYPVLRHHFGLPSVEETIQGIEEISRAKILDIVSIGPDQNAQQFFFQQEKMNQEYDGAGGVPLRTREDFISLKKATRFGNSPLLRCYSGTGDVFQYASLLKDTINNAWAAIPLCWYNELDGRGTRAIEESFSEAQELIKWHVENNIPVEINEPHHWGLRDAHDVIPVVMAYVSAYNAKKLGVKNYIAQYMFNNPNGLSFSMDFAKVLAMIEMVESLEDETFKTYRQTRAGLPLFHADPDVAKGQLAASTFMQMMIKPHIIHVVAYCEADHAATPAEVIESCKIVKGVIKHTVNDSFGLDKSEHIVQRKEELIREAKLLIEYIYSEFSDVEEPLMSAKVISTCIKSGIIDAVHIVKNEKFKGKLHTRFVDGKCIAFDENSNRELTEHERLEEITIDD